LSPLDYSNGNARGLALKSSDAPGFLIFAGVMSYGGVRPVISLRYW